MSAKRCKELYEADQALDETERKALAQVVDDARKEAVQLLFKKIPSQKQRKAGPDLSKLPEEDIQPIAERCQQEQNKIRDSIASQRTAIRKELEMLLPDIKMISAAEYHTLRRDDGINWHTQGFGANTYAAGALENYAVVLRENGFDARVDEEKGECSRAHNIQYMRYALVANCEPWQFSVLRSRILLTRWLELCRINRLNPWVYDPFLPHTKEINQIVYPKSTEEEYA